MYNPGTKRTAGVAFDGHPSHHDRNRKTRVLPIAANHQHGGSARKSAGHRPPALKRFRTNQPEAKTGALAGGYGVQIKVEDPPLPQVRLTGGFAAAPKAPSSGHAGSTPSFNQSQPQGNFAQPTFGRPSSGPPSLQGGYGSNSSLGQQSSAHPSFGGPGGGFQPVGGASPGAGFQPVGSVGGPGGGFRPVGGVSPGAGFQPVGSVPPGGGFQPVGGVPPVDGFQAINSAQPTFHQRAPPTHQTHNSYVPPTQHIPQPQPTQTLHRPALNLRKPNEPAWFQQEKFGMLMFEPDIMIYHFKGFPMCPWEDLLREGPLDPKWEQQKQKNKQLKQEEGSDGGDDEAYVPPGASHHVQRRRPQRQQNNSHLASKPQKHTMYYDPSEGVLAENPHEMSPEYRPPARRQPPLPRFKWIQCIYCSKWRKIPATVPDAKLGDQWYCNLNYYDPNRNSCDAPQEYEQPVPQAPPQPAPKRPRKRGTRPGTMSVAESLSRMKPTAPELMKQRAEFYESLENFLGTPPSVSTLCGKPIDLFHVYSEVTGRGGYEEVTQNKQWRQIFRTMENYSEHHTSASYALKKCYRKNLLAYEQRYFTEAY